MAADVITFPAPQVSAEVTTQGGDYTVHIKVSGSGRYPMKGGQGDYQPEQVLLVWQTRDGGTWTFRHAIITGRQVEKRTGELSTFGTAQTLYPGDPAYADCEPEWLATLIEESTPGGAR